MAMPAPSPLAAPQDLAWLASLVGGETWPALTPAAEARLAALLGRIGLEHLLPLLEGAARNPAIAAYRAWLAANPAASGRFAALFNLGVQLGGAGETAAAIGAYREALALKPDLWQAAVNLGLALEALGQPDAALATWGEALQPDAARIALLNHRGRLQEQMRQFGEAEATLRASLRLDPQQPDVIQHWHHLRQKGCLWPLWPEGGVPGLPEAEAMAQAGPLGALAMTDDVAELGAIVARWIARKVPPAPERLAPPEGYRHDRIRVGYLSSDLGRHAMGFLIVGLLEQHDHERFEITAYCSSPDDGSEVQARIRRALDRHVPVRHMTDEQLARRIRADEIDILVDLNGLTQGARLQALRWKPAPVQATYLGYIGPVPLPELDWFICDAVTVPPEQEAAYAPRPLRLDGLYQSNDGRMPELPPLSRAEEGLPEDVFVYACFSHHYKITEPMFESWLEVLRQVPRALLWLVEDTPTSREALLARAAARGVAADRLVFAPRAEPARYMARFALADLFLDTTPYNAGTVASDALRMGLPLLTLPGRSFASRMATSLLTAIGLADGIAESAADYVARAIAFGTDPSRHARAKAVLAGDAWACTIGDSAAFARRIEAAYAAIRLHPG